MYTARPSVFDASGQVSSQSALTESYRWKLDGVNNWVEYQSPTTTETRSYNTVNQDVASGYDGNGNRTKDNEHTYIFDAFNRLIEVWDAAGTMKLETYTYDVFGRRMTTCVRNTDNTFTTTKFYYDADHVIEERVNNRVVARNYYAPHIVDHLIARETTTTGLYWLHTDLSNSVVAATDLSGHVLERYQYMPFGEVVFLNDQLQPILDAQGTPKEYSSINNPYLFTSRRYDRTGLYYYRDRYYDPHFGRFLSRDSDEDPLNVGNMYGYAGQNPLVYIDPWGTNGMQFRFMSWDRTKEKWKEGIRGIGKGA